MSTLNDSSQEDSTNLEAKAPPAEEVEASAESAEAPAETADVHPAEGQEVAEAQEAADDAETEPTLEDLAAEVAKYKDLYLRSKAEEENARKRKVKEIAEARQKTQETVVRAILPIIDNLERAGQSAQMATDIDAVIQGISMILRSFEETSERIGLKRVESVGTRFDPGMHEAWQHTETDEHEVGTVIAEFESGYMLGARLLRPAKVAVARPPSKAEAAPEPAEEEPEVAEDDDEDVLFIEEQPEEGENAVSDSAGDTDDEG